MKILLDIINLFLRPFVLGYYSEITGGWFVVTNQKLSWYRELGANKWFVWRDSLPKWNRFLQLATANQVTANSFKSILAKESVTFLSVFTKLFSKPGSGELVLHFAHTNDSSSPVNSGDRSIPSGEGFEITGMTITPDHKQVVIQGKYPEDDWDCDVTDTNNQTTRVNEPTTFNIEDVSVISFTNGSDESVYRLR